MDGNLKVTPDTLINTANEFNGTGTQINNLTQQMLSIVNSLKSTWQGEAATAYSSKFNALEDDMQKMHRMIQEHVTDLNEMATNYKAAEAQNMDAATALPADVIQ